MAKRDFRALKGGADTSIPETAVARLAAEALSAPQQERLTAEEFQTCQEFNDDIKMAVDMLNRYVNKLAIRHKCGPKDKLDITTGVITRAPKEPSDG